MIMIMSNNKIAEQKFLNIPPLHICEAEDDDGGQGVLQMLFTQPSVGCRWKRQVRRVPGAVYVAAVAAVCIASSPYECPTNSSVASPHQPAPADDQFASSWPYCFPFLSFRCLARDSVCGSLHRAIAELGRSKFALAAPLDVTERMADFVVEPVTDTKFATSLTVPGSTAKLFFVGAGVREKKIAFLNVKVYALALYVEAGIRGSLSAWQGKSAADLARDATFFKALSEAPVQKALQLVLVRDIAGAQFWGALDESVRPRLKAVGAGEAGDAALADLGKVFQNRALKQCTVINLTWVQPATLKVTVASSGLEKPSTVASIDSLALLSSVFDIYLGVTPISPGAKCAFAAGVGKLL